MKQTFFKLQRILIGPDQMRNQILVRRRIIQNFNMIGGLNEELGGRARAQQGRENKKEPGGFPQDSCRNEKRSQTPLLRLHSGRQLRAEVRRGAVDHRILKRRLHHESLEIGIAH